MELVDGCLSSSADDPTVQTDSWGNTSQTTGNIQMEFWVFQPLIINGVFMII